MLELASRQRRQFDGPIVETIEKRGDSLKNGALIGLVAGFLPGAYVGAALGGETGDLAEGALVVGLFYGGIGAAIGTGIDALIKGHRVIYAKSKTTVSVQPVISRDRKGVVFTLRR